jgi:hypothetical protein
LSTNDVLIILLSNLLVPLSRAPLDEAVEFLQEHQAQIAALQEECWSAQDVKTTKQPTLFEL